MKTSNLYRGFTEMKMKFLIVWFCLSGLFSSGFVFFYFQPKYSSPNVVVLEESGISLLIGYGLNVAEEFWEGFEYELKVIVRASRGNFEITASRGVALIDGMVHNSPLHPSSTEYMRNVTFYLSFHSVKPFAQWNVPVNTQVLRIEFEQISYFHLLVLLVKV